MKLVTRVIDAIARTVMGTCAIVLFTVTFLQVVFRYLLKSPLPWSQDVVRLCFVYVVFWGAAYCVRDKAHLNIDVMLTLISRKARKVVEILINIILVAFFVFIAWVGIEFAKSGSTQTAPYLPIPMMVYYLSLPTSAVLMVYYMIKNILEQIRNFNQNVTETEIKEKV